MPHGSRTATFLTVPVQVVCSVEVTSDMLFPALLPRLWSRGGPIFVCFGVS